MTHTPGPWAHAEDGFIYGGPEQLKIADPHCTGELDPDEREANANLIAGAPDMLEALQSIADYPTNENSEPDEMAIALALMRQIAIDAIAKARP